eukprot:469389_1
MPAVYPQRQWYPIINNGVLVLVIPKKYKGKKKIRLLYHRKRNKYETDGATADDRSKMVLKIQSMELNHIGQGSTVHLNRCDEQHVPNAIDGLFTKVAIRSFGALDHNETRNISKRVIKEKKKRKDRQSLLERQPPLERGYMTPMTQIPHIAEVEYFKEIYKECFDLKEMYAKMEIQPNKQFIECVAMLLDIKSPRDTLSKEIRMLSKQS